MLLENRVGIVSGVGPGMGREIALAFAREGADVALGARHEEQLKEVAAEVEQLGRRAFWLPTDITDPAQCRRLADGAREALGRIDILVNNAHYSQPRQLFAESNLNDWRQAMEVNYWGSLNMTQAAVPYMRELGEGRVIMINTLVVRKPNPAGGPYVGSKSALAGTTRVLAKELGEFGIRVNSIHPSYIYGPSMKRHFAQLAAERGVDAQVVYDEIASQTALNYIPPVEEVAGVVLFFASDLARPITGQSLDVNAGEAFH